MKRQFNRVVRTLRGSCQDIYDPPQKTKHKKPPRNCNPHAVLKKCQDITKINRIQNFRPVNVCTSFMATHPVVGPNWINNRRTMLCTFPAQYIMLTLKHRSTN